MSDLYDEMINRFISPLSVLERGVIDALYFMRSDGSFAFTEGYCHPEGGMTAKIMLQPSPKGDVNIFGRRFRSSYKRVVDGRTELIPHDEQLAVQYELTPGLRPDAFRPPYADYHVELPLRDFIGVFEHRRSLRAGMEVFPGLKASIESLSRGFSVPVSRLGVTGSTCYGKFEQEDEDIDLVWYGSIRENARILEKIRAHTRDPRNRVFEFGKRWPIRFYWNGVMICSFFNYSRDEEIPLRKCRMEVLEPEVSGEGRVADDTHSIYMPSILTLGDLTLGGTSCGDLDLILYDGSLRGEYFAGDRVKFRARRVGVETGARNYEALLVTISDNISRCEG